MRHIPKFLIKISKEINSLIGGKEDQTLCERFYSWKMDKNPFGYVLVFITDLIFWWDKNHCRKSYLLGVRRRIKRRRYHRNVR